MATASQKVPILQLWSPALALLVGEAAHHSQFFSYHQWPFKPTWTLVKSFRWGARTCCLLAALHVKRVYDELEPCTTLTISWWYILLTNYWKDQKVTKIPIISKLHLLIDENSSFSGLGKGRRFTQTKGGSRRAAWLRKNSLKLRRKR